MKVGKHKLRIPLFTLCNYCESDLANSWDHIMPRSHGGEDIIENLVPVCKRCNSIASNIIFPTLEKKKAYVKHRIQLTRKPKVILKTYSTFMVNMIKSCKIHISIPEIDEGQKPLLAPIGVWLPATHENVLRLAFGRPIRRLSQAPSTR